MIHRRFGKTVYAINKLIRDVIECQQPMAQGHYFAPTYKQAKSIAWKYLQAFTAPMIPGMKYNKTELCATFPNGDTISLIGGDNYDSFRGNYSDSVVIDEVADMPIKLWSEVVRPALSDRDGKGLFIGTPKGRNAFYDLYERAGMLDDWWRCKLAYYDTDIIKDSEIKSLKKEMAKEEFQQEFECSFQAAIRGAYFGQTMAELERLGRITNVPYDPIIPVTTAWDLGMRDATAVHFIQASPGGEVRLIDYEEYHGASIPDIIQKLREKPYKYGRHIAPHDIRVRELGTGTSRLEVASNHGINFEVCRNMPLMDGIDATRNLLRKCWIDKDKCRTAVNSLQLYRADMNEKTGVFSTRPRHDHTSHCCDALRMYAVELGGRQSPDSSWGTGINYDMLNKVAV